MRFADQDIVCADDRTEIMTNSQVIQDKIDIERDSRRTDGHPDPFFVSGFKEAGKTGYQPEMRKKSGLVASFFFEGNGRHFFMSESAFTEYPVKQFFILSIHLAAHLIPG